MSEANVSSEHDRINNDLSREVYGIFGITVDAIDQRAAIKKIQSAINRRQPLLLSTPNLSFLIQSQSDQSFRQAILQSDLCTPDGMPIVWFLHLFGAHIKERVAGSDLFEALKAETHQLPIKVFLFGGQKGVAEQACTSLNATATGLVCAGWYDPGFADVEAMSTTEILSTINDSGADFLSVSIGAQKGQAWLIKNHGKIKIPVRAYLGATINFEIGNIKRAPNIFRRSGFEWLWRITQEPHLARRYWRDAWKLLLILLTRALPLIAQSTYFSIRCKDKELTIASSRQGESTVITLSGHAITKNIPFAIPALCEACLVDGALVIDMSAVDRIDARFTGLLLMLKKQQQRRGPVELVNFARGVRATLALNGFRDVLMG